MAKLDWVGHPLWVVDKCACYCKPRGSYQQLLLMLSLQLQSHNYYTTII